MPLCGSRRVTNHPDPAMATMADIATTSIQVLEELLEAEASLAERATLSEPKAAAAGARLV